MLCDIGKHLADSTAAGGQMQLLGCGCLAIAAIAILVNLWLIWAIFSWIF